jgi:hypothetical protein
MKRSVRLAAGLLAAGSLAAGMTGCSTISGKYDQPPPPIATGVPGGGAGTGGTPAMPNPAGAPSKTPAVKK